MGWSKRIFFTAFVLLAAAIDAAHGAAMITGTVFCDQCKDGQVSLFDYPLYGVKVTMSCPGSDGQFTTWAEETTNWLGNYAIRMDGTPNLSQCYTQVSSGNGQGSNGCGAAGGPPKNLRLMFDMFDMEMYAVDPLISQPAEPMSFCPRSTSPAPVVPVNPAPIRLPPSPLPPVPRLPPFPSLPLPPVPRLPPFPSLPLPPVPRLPPFPSLPLPPVPRLPPFPSLPLPPVPRLPPFPPSPAIPFLEDSTCPHQKWMMPEYRCYWKVVTPDTKVGVAFGVVATRKYGADMTLGQGMRGRGDPYRTLLREGTTALLNSYNSIQFPYHPVGVIQNMNWALMGSTRHVLHTALSFMRANSGLGTNATCTFTTCK